MQPRDPQPAAPPRPGLARLAALQRAVARADDERALLVAVTDLLAREDAPDDHEPGEADDHEPDDPLAALARRWPAAPDDPLRALVTTTVSLALTRLRERHAREHDLAAARSLHAALAALHAAADPDALLAVLADHAARHGASAAWLLGPGDAGPIVLGRRGASELPPALAGLATAAPRFIPSLADAAPLRAAAVLPLGDSVGADGHVVLAWPDHHDFSPDERDHYLALAHQAAVVLTNHRLLAAATAALHDQQRQRATLAAILDHLPVGVVVQSAAAGQPLLMNRRADELRRDLVTSPLLFPGSDTPMPPASWPLARALHDDQVVVGEAELRAPDGSRRALEAVAAPIHDEHGALTHVISVTTEVTAWRAAEAEREAMQAALIRAQEAALAERSAPLLPIADTILVLPIIGAIDEHRGQQITETLVHLGGSQRVRVAILDVTGAGALDPGGAHLLVGAARALRLRGVRPILTGLGPEAAAALAAAGVDLAGVTVLGSLQAGIARARALTRR